MRALAFTLLSAALAACSIQSPAPEGSAPEHEKPAAAPAKTVEWPTYHGSTSLEGVADLALPDTLSTTWTFQAKGQVYNTPVSADGFVAFSDSKGTLYVLSLDGVLVWSKEITEPGYSGGTPIQSMFDAPLAIFEHTLIACSASGYVHAFNLPDGVERWTADTKHSVLGAPTFAEVLVDGAPKKRLFFIDQSEGSLQGMDFDTGTILWSGKGVARCDGSPAASDKYVVYGSCASAVHIFSTQDGSMAREIPIEEESQVAGGVVMLGDFIFSGSRSGRFVHANAATGEIIWTNSDCEGEAHTTPAVDDEHVVFGANDGMLYTLERKSGKLLWKRELGDTPASAVIARDKVIVTADGKLHLLRLSDGGIIATYPVSDELTSPCIAGNLVVVGGDDGVVTAFSGKSGA